MRKLAPKVLMVAAAVGIGLYCNRTLWQRVHQEQKAAQVAREQMDAAEARKVDLTRQKAEVESEAGRERLAREKGWIGPGEKPL